MPETRVPPQVNPTIDTEETAVPQRFLALRFGKPAIFADPVCYDACAWSIPDRDL